MLSQLVNSDLKAHSLLSNTDDLNMDIELLEDQLYGISGSLGLDLDFLKNNEASQSDLMKLIQGADTMSANQLAVPTGKKRTSSELEELPDPELFFNPDLHEELISTTENTPKKLRSEEDEKYENELAESLEKEILSLEDLLE